MYSDFTDLSHEDDELNSECQYFQRVQLYKTSLIVCGFFKEINLRKTDFVTFDFQSRN